jgi:cytidine deaminase
VETSSYDRLEASERELIDAARAVADTAYAPYSNVRVGAAIRSADGAIITGSNVENAAYGATICAERMAVGRANAEGHRAFTHIAVTATGEHLASDHPVAPCGACRQVLHEMAAITGTDTRVLMATPGTDIITVASLDELLPLPFDPLSL